MFGRCQTADGSGMTKVTSCPLHLKGNKSKISALAEVVRSYGITEGQPLFLSGRRKIDDEEFEYQQSRLNLGLVPDPLDIGSYKDEMKKLGNLRG